MQSKLAAVKQIRKYMMSKAERSKLEAFFAAPLGLIINQRLANIPTEVVEATHAALYDEVQWVLDNEKVSCSFLPSFVRSFVGWLVG